MNQVFVVEKGYTNDNHEQFFMLHSVCLELEKAIEQCNSICDDINLYPQVQEWKGGYKEFVDSESLIVCRINPKEITQ